MSSKSKNNQPAQLRAYRVWDKTHPEYIITVQAVNVYAARQAFFTRPDAKFASIMSNIWARSEEAMVRRLVCGKGGELV